MAYGTISEIREALRSGESALSITESYLKRIKEFQNLNAFIEIFEEDALRQAKDVDVKIANGTAGQLAGCVVAIKDNICFKGHRVTASSKILDGFESLFTATALQRLIDQDVIVIGRLNCDEFAMGSSNETSVYGPVKTTSILQKYRVALQEALLLLLQQDYAHFHLEVIQADLYDNLRHGRKLTDLNLPTDELVAMV